MMHLNWHTVERTARDGQRKCRIPKSAILDDRQKLSMSRASARTSKVRWMFAISILVMLSAAIIVPSGVRASLSPTVLITPASVPIGAAGTTVTIQVKVQNMDQFNGWDIQVYAYPPVLNATSLSITGNDFAVNASSGSAFEIVHCVNGKGTGCISTDLPGVVHSAYGNTGVLTGNGLLFTITYQVTGNPAACSCTLFSPIVLNNDLISSPNSPNGVPHISISANYGQYAGGGGGNPPRPK